MKPEHGPSPLAHKTLQLVNVGVFCQLEPVFMLGHALWSSPQLLEAWMRGGEANLEEKKKGGGEGAVL